MGTAVQVLHALRDPLWGAIGGIAAVVAVVVAAKTRRYKRLSYHITEQGGLYTGDKDLLGLLEVRFRNETIRSLYIVDVAICNCGNTAIMSKDYEEPLAIRFPKSATIVGANAVATRPLHTPIGIEIAGSNIIVHPKLLNEDDAFIVRVFAAIPDADDKGLRNSSICLPIAVTTHIVGMKDTCRMSAKQINRLRNKIAPTDIFLDLRQYSRGTRPPYDVIAPLTLHIPNDDTIEVDFIEKENEDASLEDSLADDATEEASNTCDEPSVQPDSICDWNKLTPDEQKPFLEKAPTWLLERGIEAQSDTLKLHMAQALWRKENAVKHEIRREFIARKGRAARSKKPDDIEKATRRMPDENTKD